MMEISLERYFAELEEDTKGCFQDVLVDNPASHRRLPHHCRDNQVEDHDDEEASSCQEDVQSSLSSISSWERKSRWESCNCRDPTKVMALPGRPQRTVMSPPPPPPPPASKLTDCTNHGEVRHGLLSHVRTSKRMNNNNNNKKNNNTRESKTISFQQPRLVSMAGPTSSPAQYRKHLAKLDTILTAALEEAPNVAELMEDFQRDLEV